MIDLGSSEAPAVMGVSPYLTPWQLWARKVELLPADTEDTEIMQRGRQLESAVLDMFLGELHIAPSDVERSPYTMRWRQDRPWQRATPDALVIGRALVEVKCVVGYPPPAPRVDWLVQCLHQRMVYPEFKGQYLVAFGNLQLTWWEIPWHQAALDRLLREEERFLELVERETPPPVRAADAAVLGKAWPITTPEPVELDEATERVAREYVAMKENLSKGEKLAAEGEAILKAALADHEEGVFPNGGRITWKPYTRKGYTVQEQSVRRLTIKQNGGDE
jgi:predicted phage-related endonuclease